MKAVLNSKFALISSPLLVDNDAPVGCKQDSSPVSIDTRGWGMCVITVIVGVTDIALTALNVYESDNDSTYTEIPGLDFANDYSGGLPGATNDNNVYRAVVDLRGPRKRYIQADVVVGDGTAGANVCVFAELFEPELGPDTTSELIGGGLVAAVPDSAILYA